MAATRQNEQGEIVADFSDAGIPNVDGTFIVRVDSDDFRAEKIRADDFVIFNPTDKPQVGRVVAVETDDGALRVHRCESESEAVAGIAVGLIRRV